MTKTNMILAVCIITYVFVLAIVITRRNKRNKAVRHLLKKTDIYLFFYEKRLLEILKINPSRVKNFICFFRIFFALTIFISSFRIGYIAVFAALASIILVYMYIENQQLLESVGVKYLILVTQFLDSYIPKLSSGVSNDQAMATYVNSTNDEELINWWLNKDNIENPVAPSLKWRRVVDIYNMVKHNEEQGIGDSLPIIEEMQQDLINKQSFFNEYQAKIGEIKPIIYSYYVGVPIILILSVANVEHFWKGFGGLVCSLILASLFFFFEFLIYKLRKNTIEKLF